MSRKRLDPHRETRLREVCGILGYEFRNLAILNRALSHSSLGNEGLPDYERLEFLGDAVLGFLVAESLYNHEPEVPEGELTSRRSMMVSRRPLSTVARELDLGSYILVGRGLTDENISSPRILADLVEAVLAAIYLDGGIKPARRFVQRFVIERFKDDPKLHGTTDAKTRLNQWAQSRDIGPPRYEIIETTGPDHDPTFRVAVTLADVTCYSSEVKNKQTGEQEAAAECYRRLASPGEKPPTARGRATKKRKARRAASAADDGSDPDRPPPAEPTDDIQVIWDES